MKLLCGLKVWQQTLVSFTRWQQGELTVAGVGVVFKNIVFKYNNTLDGDPEGLTCKYEQYIVILSLYSVQDLLFLQSK